MSFRMQCSEYFNCMCTGCLSKKNVRLFELHYLIQIEGEHGIVYIFVVEKSGEKYPVSVKLREKGKFCMARDLNLLFTFIHVVQSGSFTAAARKLDLPTSTVSRHVTRLEEQLDIRLLHRTTRSLHLTEAGQLYYESGIKILDELEYAETILTETRTAPKGRIRVSGPVEYNVLMDATTEFLELYPDVQIELELTNRRVRLVEEGFDLAIRAGVLDDSSLIAYKLGISQVQLFASPTYLNKHGRPSSICELEKLDCVVFGRLSSRKEWVLKGKDGTVHVQIRGRVAVNHMEALRDLAVGGFGVALLPAVSCVNEITSGALESVLPEFSSPSVTLWAVYPSRRFLTPAVRIFIEFLKEHFQKQLKRSE